MTGNDIKYPISAISRLRIGTDGHGVRTLIALSGCPLRCRYCINSFTWDGSKKPYMLTAKELYDRVRRDLIYMLATNAGVTFGGGEPLMHAGIIREFRDICGKDLNIFVETSFHVPWKNIEILTDVVDKFIVDIKSMDSDIYKAYTGNDNDIPIDNIKRMVEAGMADRLYVRVPIIPGMADDKSQSESVEKLKKLGVAAFDCFKYRRM